jgi:hypothetical protein
MRRIQRCDEDTCKIDAIAGRFSEKQGKKFFDIFKKSLSENPKLSGSGEMKICSNHIPGRLVWRPGCLA